MTGTKGGPRFPRTIQGARPAPAAGRARQPCRRQGPGVGQLPGRASCRRSPGPGGGQSDVRPLTWTPRDLLSAAPEPLSPRGQCRATPFHRENTGGAWGPPARRAHALPRCLPMATRCFMGTVSSGSGLLEACPLQDGWDEGSGASGHPGRGSGCEGRVRRVSRPRLPAPSCPGPLPSEPPHLLLAHSGTGRWRR